MASVRLLKKAHLRRWPARVLVAAYPVYASLGLPHSALHLDLFEQPAKTKRPALGRDVSWGTPYGLRVWRVRARMPLVLAIPRQVSRLFGIALGDRPTAGQQTLDLLIGVRIPVPQPLL